MLAHEYIQHVVKKQYTKTKLLQFIDDITVYLHNQTVFQIVFRINDNLINQYRRCSGDKTANKYIINTNISPVKIIDDLINKSVINDIILVYNTRSQIIEVLPGSAEVWESVQAMTE